MQIVMDVDIALSEVPVNLMPLIDDGDFKTRETSVAYNAGGMDLVWNFVTTGGAYTQTAVTPTTSGDYDWAHQGDGMYSIEMPASGGASINNDTEGFGWFTGVASGVLPWRGPVICFRAAGLNNILIDSAYSATRGLAGTALPDAAAEAAGGLYTRGSGAGQINQPANGMVDTNPVRLGGVAQSLTDLKDFADTGYDPSTHKVQGVVLTDTATTLTNAPSDSAGVTTLLSRLSALRAGYLDNLSAGAVATAAKLLSYFQSALRKDVTVDADIGGNYDDATDSQEAIRDRGDAAWLTATGFSTHSASDVWAVGTRRLTDATNISGPIADQVWEEALADHEGTAGSTAEALAQAGGSGASAADIADAVWDEARAGHVTAGSFGQGVASVQGNVTGSVASVTAGVSLADDAITAAKFDESTAFPVKSADTGSTQIARVGADGDTLETLSDQLDTKSSQTSVDDIPTNAELATALAAADDAVLAAIAALNNLSAAQVNAQVVDALAVDTYAEPSAPPAATATLAAKIGWLAILARNKIQQTATTQTLLADNGSTSVATAAVSDDTVTFERSEWQ